MAIVRLALLSLRNRWLTALLAILAIALSVTLFLGVERVRISAKSSFADTISGTDLIVGARAGDVQLLLYSVFRIGNATRNITMRSLDDIRGAARVAWGDSPFPRRQPPRLSRARNHDGLLRAPIATATAGLWASQRAGPSTISSTRCSAPMSPRNWDIG